jgi:multiple antibiotic resistance protein
MNFFSLTLILFLIMDPLGNIAYFNKTLQHIPAAQHPRIVMREMLIALFTVLCFSLLGDWIFTALSVSPASVSLSSGTILFLTALKILFPSSDSMRARSYHGDPFVIPLAIPFIAGPSLLATVMLFARLESSTTMLAAIGIAWVCSTIILLLATPIQRIMSNNGLQAFEKLVGMILIMLSIQRFGEGIREFITTYVPS